MPTSVVKDILGHHQSKQTAKDDVLADLSVVAVFYMLRPGEYTMPSRNRRTRTVQFRRQDVRLWKNGHLLSHDLPIELLLAADSATLHLDNQKNSQRGATIHHYARDDAFCPVKALARLVHRLRQLTPEWEAPLSLYGTAKHIISADITSALRQALVRTGLLSHGYRCDRVSAHSLRAGGAMALKLAGVNTDLIKKVGRWSSDTWLTYIHSQIGELTAGLSELMAIDRVFRCVG